MLGFGVLLLILGAADAVRTYVFFPPEKDVYLLPFLGVCDIMAIDLIVMAFGAACAFLAWRLARSASSP